MDHSVPMSPIRSLPFIALLLLPASPAAGADVPAPDRELLDRAQPGWTVLEHEESLSSGELRMERKVWPMLYIHWWPWEEEMGRTIGLEAAGELVAGIWEGLTIDSPLEGREIALPQHPAILFETTISHGEWSTRYVAWYCPESFRVFVADANLYLGGAAPEVLLDWQIDIVRTLRCHTTARVERHELMTSRRSVPRSELSLDLPEEWDMVPDYKVQSTFAGKDFRGSMPRSNALRGQTLILARDAVRQIHVFWDAEEDFPMSYDLLQEKLQNFWRPLAGDMMVLSSSATAGLWKMDGVAAHAAEGIPFRVPAVRFRGWMWRDEGVTYFVVGAITPSRFGRRDPRYDWEASLEAIRKVVDY